MQSIDLKIDVTVSAKIGEAAHVAVTVTLPDPAKMASPPIVCFAKPGGGYSRGYYTVDLPGPARGAQAEWHAARGWIFVSVDHLGVGGSSIHDAAKLDYTTTASGSMAAEAEILRRLAEGTLAEGFPAITDPVKIGIGQSMGGCMTIIQQGRYHCYDGIGILGYSAIHTHPPVRPGTDPIIAPWLPRDTLLRNHPPVVVNTAAVTAYMAKMAGGSLTGSPSNSAEHPMLWGFHYADDYDSEMNEAALIDLARFFHIHNPELQVGVTCQPWGSLTTPGAVAQSCLTPGSVAPEAAAVTVPVLVAMGERDTCADVAGEPRAYRSANSVDLFICPRMSHMHNFAATRVLFWKRLERFAEWAACVKSTEI
jgi:alpha-beta hydrolase superfamily lysophospholipase